MPSFRQPGIVLTDHEFEVPLDHADPHGAQITVFAREVVAADKAARAGEVPWSVLGQSFGGFCAVTYLSQAPGGLAEVFIGGGLPGLETSPDEVYLATYPLVAAKNAAHYERYPGDAEAVRRILARLLSTDVLLPSGAALTAEAFQALGVCLGSATGSHELHYLLETAFDGDELGDEFLYRLDALLTFAGGPLYAALHEACYAQQTATRWSANRIRERFPAFSAKAALDGTGPVLFTGEMIYPWMFRSDPVLRPLAEAAEILAEHDAWPALYDPARLAANEVPVAAAVYYDDMYVPQQFSLQTAARIRGLRRWVTSEYEHDGLRLGRGAVLDRLIGLVRCTV